MEETPNEQSSFDAPPVEPLAVEASAVEAPEPPPPPKSRGLGRGRLFVGMAVTVAVVAGGAAFALAGGDDGDGDGDGGDGVASIDGSGNSGSDGDDNSGSGEETSMEDAVLEYAECMREHGVDMPDPKIDGDRVSMSAPGGGDPEEMDAANEACQNILDKAEPPEGDKPSPEEIAKRQDEAVAMAECMRGRGYDFPDPEVGEDGGIQVKGGGPPADGDTEQFEKDMSECQEESGMEGPGEGNEGSLDSETET